MQVTVVIEQYEYGYRASAIDCTELGYGYGTSPSGAVFNFFNHHITKHKFEQAAERQKELDSLDLIPQL
jgi:hypothetical protein